MTFRVQRVDTAETVSEHETGAEAGTKASERNNAARASGKPERYRVLRVADDKPADGWRQCEAYRFIDGRYKPVPWASEPWCNADHFAHVSEDDPTKVAFTPDDAFGRDDRQLRMRPGRYLERYYSNHIGPLDIQKFAGMFAGENTLRFADTPDDIEDVYTHGPTSCMSYKAEDYASPCHPTRVYGAGDLAVAYLQRGDAVTARAVCWPSKQRFSRIYGDESRLRPLLEQAGFSHNGNFTGARLLRIGTDDDAFVMPYLDGNDRARESGKFLIIDDDGERDCKTTNGLTSPAYSFTCDRCGDGWDEDDTYCVDGGEAWCSDCYTNAAWRCYACEEVSSGSPYLTTHNGLNICENCADDWTECYGCNEYFPNDDVEYSEVTSESYCRSCAANMQRTHCGQLANSVDDCACRECEDARGPESFELSYDGDQHPRQTPKPAPKREPSPTVTDDPRQLELFLLEDWQAIYLTWCQRGRSLSGAFWELRENTRMRMHRNSYLAA